MDHYTILNVARDADTATIEKAFRKMSLKFHPDKANAATRPAGAESESQRTAREARNNERYMAMIEAREVLTDATKRQEYDEEQEGEATHTHHKPSSKHTDSATSGGSSSHRHHHHHHRRRSTVHESHKTCHTHDSRKSTNTCSNNGPSLHRSNTTAGSSYPRSSSKSSHAFVYEDTAYFSDDDGGDMSSGSYEPYYYGQQTRRRPGGATVYENAGAAMAQKGRLEMRESLIAGLERGLDEAMDAVCRTEPAALSGAAYAEITRLASRAAVKNHRAREKLEDARCTIDALGWDSTSASSAARNYVQMTAVFDDADARAAQFLFEADALVREVGAAATELYTLGRWARHRLPARICALLERYPKF